MGPGHGGSMTEDGNGGTKLGPMYCTLGKGSQGVARVVLSQDPYTDMFGHAQSGPENAMMYGFTPKFTSSL